MRALLVAALFVLGLFAGCLDDSDDSFGSAADAYPMARREAKKWNPDAELIGANSYEVGADLLQDARSELAEARDELAEEERDCIDEAEDEEEAQECRDEFDEYERELRVAEAIVAAGPNPVGDGRTAVWSFAFRAPESDMLVVFVNARKVLFSDETDLDEDFIEPIGEWPVDSDEAANVAREGDEAYAAAVGSTDSYAYSFLINPNGQPFWLLGIEDDEGGGDVIVAVDAVNATLVPFEQVLGLFLPLFQEFGSEADSFTPIIGGQASTSFQVEQTGHANLAVHVSVMPPPVSPVSVTVTDPLGRELSFEVAMCVAVAAEESVVVPGVPVGVWQVTLSTDLAANQNWQMSWCTDGIVFTAFPFVGPPACDVVPNPDARAQREASVLSETISRWTALVGL